MVIGSGVSDYWGIFKSYWDIVVTWFCNYKVDSEGGYVLDYMDKNSLRVVDHKYQTGSYCLCKGMKLVTK